MDVIDLQRLHQSLERSLDLLRTHYRSSPSGGGGWYHRLENEIPGPSATAVGLNSFLLCGSTIDHLGEGLAFLRSRQVQSDDPVKNGGWAVNTSFGQPVTEATGWVSRFLGLARIGLRPEAPNVELAYRWLVNNQNGDGGWGSFAGQPSRTWLTCMALRAIAVLYPHSPAVDDGVEWLLKQRSASLPAWGERGASLPTVTHTAFVLLTLSDVLGSSYDKRVGDVVNSAYRWLEDHLQTDVIHDEAARVENYNVTGQTLEGRPITWLSSIWHPGLPFAVSALVRHPNGCRPDLLCSAVETIIDRQLGDGSWPSLDGAAGISVWAVWPFVQALSDVEKIPIASIDAKITWISSNAIVVQRGDARAEAIGSLLRGSRRKAVVRNIRRHWATAVLVLFVVAGLSGVMLNWLEAKDFALSLLLPVVLLVIQEARHRRGVDRDTNAMRR